MAYGQQYSSWGAQGGGGGQGGWGGQGGQQQQSAQSWGGQQGNQQNSWSQQGQQSAQGWGGQQGGWGQQGQQGQQAAQQQAPQAQQQQPQADSKDVTLVVTGCTHGTVGPIVRGTFQLHGENHGKPTYKKDSQANGLDVMSYYWDERDGPGFCGWWFGPKVGGDQVWAYHTDKTANTPPQTGWKVPYDGPVDPTFVISVKAKGGQQAGQQAQQQPQQQGWGQQQQQGWGQQQQGWGQQQQQGQWGQQQGGMQAAKEMEQKKLEEQRKQLEMLKQKQMQENAAKANEMRMKQQAEQARRMEEQRQKVEAARLQQVEEQKKKMEEMKRRQQEVMQKRVEEERRKKEEMEKKRQEQMAVLAIRKVMQKYRSVAPDKHMEVKQELDEVISQHLEACGSQKDKLTTEIEQAVTATKTRIEQVEEMKRKEEERKQAELIKKKEAREKAVSLCQELEGLVVAAEEKSKAVIEEAEPLKDEKAEMTVRQIETCVIAVEEASKECTSTTQIASDFATKEATAIKSAPAIPGEQPLTVTQDYAKLLVRLAEVKKNVLQTVGKCNQAKTIRLKKAEAKEKHEKTFATFKKYAKEGKLGKNEIKQFAKGEYSFSVPAQVLETALRVLVKGADKGISKEKFQALKSMIGVAREAAIDEKKKKAGEEREKMIAAKKEKLQEAVKQAGELITAASEAVTKADKQSTPLTPAKAKTMTSVEMVKLADETDGVIEESKAASAKAAEAVAALAGEVEAELKSFLTVEVKKLEGSMKGFEQRITKFTQTSSKWRADAQKKAHTELEKLRVDGIDMMYRYMGEKRIDGEALFMAIDKNKNGKIEESELVKFFKTNLKTEGENGEALPDEEVQRLFTYLDGEEDGCLPKDKFLSVIKKFMKTTKASVITEDISIKSKIIRRLEEGEVVEVITGPTKEEDSVVARLKVKALKDGLDGWMTPIGNQGTVFLEDGGGSFKVVKETILTGSFVIGGDSKMKDRKLKVGEICEVREWEKKEAGSGLMRMKVMMKSDGQIGWVTSVGNTGIKFLEMI